MPLLVEANDKTYLMLFATIIDWANDDGKYLTVTGHNITELSSPNIYWALNYGTDLQKFFDPEEIEWLKAIVRKTKQSSQKQSTTDSPDHKGAEGDQ